MSQHKYIYWRPDLPAEEGFCVANVHFLVGYNGGTLADFQKMAEELRETIPQATDDNIICGKIHTSDRFKGFSIIAWNGILPLDGHDLDLYTVPGGKIDYSW
jgi:hypothetical protein